VGDARARRAPIAVLLVALLVLIAVLAGLVATSAFPPPSPSVSPGIAHVLAARIVVSVPRSGPRRAQSDGIAEAVRLAVAEMNSRVTSGDVSLILTVEVLDSSVDGAWNAAAERTNLDRAVNDPSVVAYVGPSTIEGAKLVAPVALSEDLLVVTPTLSHPALTRRGYDDALYDALHPRGANAFVRTIPSDDAALRAMLRWATDRGLAPVFAQSDGTAYGDALRDGFDRLARAKGVETVDSRDPRAKFGYFGGASAELLGERVARMRAERPGLSLAGGEAMLGEAFIQRVGEAGGGVVATFAGRPLEQYFGNAGSFFRAYRDHFLITPDPYAIFGYEAGRLILDALRRSRQGARLDRASVRDAAFQTRDLEGALGRWSVDAAGDITYATLQLYVVKALPGGRFAWSWDGEIRP
jgi:branched-chain amino acid transport system substrate-binding protein